MAHAFVSALLDQLKSIAQEKVTEKWRLVTGVEQEVGKLTTKLQAFQAVLEDAEQRKMKPDDDGRSVALCLDQLRDAFYDMEDVLEEWTTETRKLQPDEGHDDGEDNAFVTLLTKVCSFFPAASNCFGSFKQLGLRHDIAVKIREINERLDDIASQKDMFKFVENVSKNVKKPEREQTTSLIDVGKSYGRVDEKNELLSKLLSESSEQQKRLHIISLVGLGGIGKTTLAQLACNNDEVIKKFDKVIWVCVSDTFEQTRIAKAILEVLDKSAASSLGEFHFLMEQIQERAKGKKVFLVLDDVWDGDYKKWDSFFCCLKSGHRESKILITTRDMSVALKMGSIDIIPVKELAEEESWLLFEGLAFFGRSSEDYKKLEPIGREIVGKCKGLPLAAKVIGNLLRSKRTEREWQRILDSEMWKVEEIGKGILPPLLLSYNDLPSNYMVKQCFSYCAIFPKDYNIRKEELITLWMAQGYLNAEEDEEMEMIGEENFNILATRSFFQEFEKDDDDNITSCKMHDIVHDFAQFVGREECLWLEINGSIVSNKDSLGEKVRHLGLNFEGGAPFPLSIHGFDRLRTLLIYDKYTSNLSLNGSILPELFSKLACLRALVIRQKNNSFYYKTNLIREIPENVGRLIHLKYLKLSELCIERLPEALCELYNLQKLDIGWCSIRELPVGIGKLTNMRSLLNDHTYSLEYMPIGISRLTNLRTLEKFVVGGGVDGSSTCRLESLKNLQLQGKCIIEGLGNVSHLDEAERVKLYNKRNLLHLRLVFDGEDEEGRRKNEKGGEDEVEDEDEEGGEDEDEHEDGEDEGEVVDGEDEEGRRKNEKDQQLLEALQPPLSVEKLWIILYRGNIFPKWLTSLTNLRKLKLFACIYCEHLPPLGNLPLEKLTLINLKSVKRVGNEFLGIKESCDDDPSSSSSLSSVIAFPKLKSLTIEVMYELEEWDYMITRKENIFIMPSLSSLRIMDSPKLKALPDYLFQTSALPILEDHRTTDMQIESCPKLKVLPDYLLQTTTLQGLYIRRCPILEERYKEGEGEDWHKISHIPRRHIW